jgi:hypothetical protein
MAKNVVSPPVDVGGSPAKWDFFGPPPLLEGEDPAAYHELLASPAPWGRRICSRRSGCVTLSISFGKQGACVDSNQA